MRQIPLPGRAKATAAHGYVLGDDGRISYVAPVWWNGGITTVSPASQTFTSLTGDWAQGNNHALAIATDGTVWTARDAEAMRQLSLPTTRQ